MRVIHFTRSDLLSKIESADALLGSAPKEKWHAIFDGPSTCVWVSPIPFWLLTPYLPFRWANGLDYRSLGYVEFDVSLRELRPAIGLKSIFSIIGPLSIWLIVFALEFFRDHSARYALIFSVDPAFLWTYFLVSLLGLVLNAMQLKIPTTHLTLAGRNPRFGVGRSMVWL